MNWKKKLKLWVDEGLISQTQSESILKFEDSKKIPYVFYSFIAVGIIVLGLGILAIVAANWDKIHYSVKLAGAFISLSAIAFFVLYSRKKEIWNDTIRYLLVLLFCVLIFACIGLVSQIYHTQGKLYQGLLLWSGITLLLVILFPGRILQHLWIAVFSYSFFDWAINRDVLDWRDGIGFSYLITYWFAWIFAGISIFSEKRIEAKESKNIFLANPFLIWTFGYFLATSVLGSLFFEREEYWRPDANVIATGFFHAWYLPFLLPLLIIGSGFGLRNFFSKRKLLLLSLSGFFLSLLFFPNLTHWSGKFLSAVLFFAAWLPFAFLFFEYRRWFDFSLLVIGLRFVVVYLEIFGSLLETGIGLVISGIFILGFSILAFKLKEKIREKANQLFPSEEQ